MICVRCQRRGDQMRSRDCRSHSLLYWGVTTVLASCTTHTSLQLSFSIISSASLLYRILVELLEPSITSTRWCTHEVLFSCNSLSLTQMAEPGSCWINSTQLTICWGDEQLIRTWLEIRYSVTERLKRYLCNRKSVVVIVIMATIRMRSVLQLLSCWQSDCRP